MFELNDLHFITCGTPIDYQVIGVPQVYNIKNASYKVRFLK